MGTSWLTGESQMTNAYWAYVCRQNCFLHKNNALPLTSKLTGIRKFSWLTWQENYNLSMMKDKVEALDKDHCTLYDAVQFVQNKNNEKGSVVVQC